MLVKVAIDLSLDRLFAYAVPAALKEKLAIGQLLSVPFGHRDARGFALALEPDAPDNSDAPGGTRSSASASDRHGAGATGGTRRSASASAPAQDAPAFKLKPIHSIVDETPFFSANLLRLVRGIADYFAAPIESVLRAAVPAAVIRPGARAKEQLFIECAADLPRDLKLTKHQEWLYDQVKRLDGGWLQQLCVELKTTPATLRALAAKGALSIEQRARRRDPLAGRRVRPSSPLALNREQSAALATIAVSPVTLLFGVTGSGKTEVYLQAIASVLGEGRGAIVMVPEIALTPQTVQRFASRFGESVAVLHSSLSEGERYDEWHRIRSGAARVVVGPRSAVFAPVKDLGLIVVDEEHDTSYKQEDNPRYNARDVAVMRGKIEGARVVLGSATPSLESWVNAQKGKYALATMRERAGAGKLPFVNIVDMREPGSRGESDAGRIFSARLLDAIKTRLDRGEQTILFLNRRGYSRSVTCDGCGGAVMCPDCSVAYTYHQADDCCRCHICGGWIPTPKVCPACKSAALTYKGIGTQRAEAALKRCFPRARVLRMDADSTSRRHSHDDILGAFRRGEADVLLGTQMIAKGLDFPNVTLVGVLNADSSLNMPDIRAAERTYQLLSQVAGRAGRAELPGEVFIQTYDSESSVIRAAARGDFAAFAAEELKVREAYGYPPYSRLSMINLKSPNAALVGEWATMYAESLKKVKGLAVSDAVPSALEKAEGWYRWQIMLRSQQAATAVKAWRWILAARPPAKDLKIALDVDAFNMF